MPILFTPGCGCCCKTSVYVRDCNNNPIPMPPFASGDFVFDVYDQFGNFVQDFEAGSGLVEIKTGGYQGPLTLILEGGGGSGDYQITLPSGCNRQNVELNVFKRTTPSGLTYNCCTPCWLPASGLQASFYDPLLQVFYDYFNDYEVTGPLAPFGNDPGQTFTQRVSVETLEISEEISFTYVPSGTTWRGFAADPNFNRWLSPCEQLAQVKVSTTFEASPAVLPFPDDSFDSYVWVYRSFSLTCLASVFGQPGPQSGPLRITETQWFYQLGDGYLVEPIGGGPGWLNDGHTSGPLEGVDAFLPYLNCPAVASGTQSVGRPLGWNVINVSGSFTTPLFHDSLTSWPLLTNKSSFTWARPFGVIGAPFLGPSGDSCSPLLLTFEYFNTSNNSFESNAAGTCPTFLTAWAGTLCSGVLTVHEM